MHAIVMVHKMQSMTLSNHQLLPTKPDSNDTNNDTSDHNSDEADNAGDHVVSMFPLIDQHNCT